MASSDSHPPRPKRIAVIAIHGVADQQREDTANTAANLLLHLEKNGTPSPYRGFKTHRLRIGLRPVKLQDSAPSFAGDPSEKCQHQFLRGQLENFEEPDPAATYDTIRNEGVREDQAGSKREVHIYEMYWADLSRLGNSFLTFFVELYQLLFHLCTVGAKTARFAREQHDDILAWRAFSRCIHFASYLIRLAVPIANLFVLALIALAASGEIPVKAPVVGTIVIAIASIVPGLVIALILRRIVAAWFWPWVLVAVAAIIAVLWFLGGLWLQPVPRVAVALSIEVWLVLLLLLWNVLKAYDRRHPDALEWGMVLGSLTSALLLVFALVGVGGLQSVCTHTANILLDGLGLAWMVAIFSALAGWIIGARAVSRTDAASKPCARRAVFTANLTTAMTGVVMLIINISLWGLIPTLLETLAPVKYAVIHGIATEMRKHLTEETILPGMTTLLILMAGVAVWAVWALIPAVRSEITTPEAETKSSRWIGQSLTNAFSVMTWGSGYVAIGCFGGLLALLSLVGAVNKAAGRFHIHFLEAIPFLANWDKSWDKKQADLLFSGFSGTILLFLIAPFFLKGFVVKLSAGFRQGLDVALDVINYLRENPADSTIRAQIFARYVSLLRYVANWKSPIEGGGGYDRIIIFAHSQGTMITVDLLRFLKVEPDPQLKFLATPDRIRLFTMGCPLRQLYGLRFPHIYDWARHSEDFQPGDKIPEGQRPDPAALLSVGTWVNAYRSGDYVGRNLWRSEKYPEHVYALSNVVSEDKHGTRREFCIGGGAHTHYWDKTALPIVEELDRLISIA